MSPWAASPWTAILVTVVVVVVLWLLLLRYRALERAGTPLPPGAGGARLVGVVGTVVVAHRPHEQRGTVHVLGDDWGVADAVDEPLEEGRPVRVLEVVGTRLVVVPVSDDEMTRQPADDDPGQTDTRSH